MKTLAHRARPVRNCLYECLRHVVAMNVMQRLTPKIRKRDFLPARERRKNLRIKVRSGVERRPPRSHEMPRMQDGGRKAIFRVTCQQVFLDSRLASSILADRPARSVFGYRNLDPHPVHPDGAAVQKLFHTPTQRVDQLPRAVQGVTGQIDHRLRAQRANS